VKNMIEFRKLTHEDYNDILDISKDIWGGTDYLPQVFHNWIEDMGLFLGGVDSEKNKVVAVGKLSVLSDGSGWLEGLRVHKDYRGLKLGRRITEEVLERAKELLAQGLINKIAFSTYIGNIESKTMMETLNFKIKAADMLAVKEISKLNPELTLEDFTVEPWEVSFEEFKNHHYFKRRKGYLPLAFVYEEVTKVLYEKLKENNCFIKINGHPGIFKFKGEPNFIAMEDTFEGINTFMDYYLLTYKVKGFDSLYTPILSEDTELIEKLKGKGYISWSGWVPDYFYYVYEGME
jgi:GNAT superfamily N-acetyltransferase